MASNAAITGKRRDHIFYVGLAIVAAAIVFVGFARTYYLRIFSFTQPLKPLLHLHGLVFTCWFVLLLVQTTLVKAGRTDIHRRLGVAGGVLAALMVVIGPIIAIRSARAGHGPPGMSPFSFMAIPLADILVFTVLVLAAFLYRRTPEAHKRLMLLATIGILGPATARLPFAFIRELGPLAYFGLADMVLLALIVYDLAVRRLVHPTYLWGGLLIVASQPLRFVLSGTSAWLAFAHWLTR